MFWNIGVPGVKKIVGQKSSLHGKVQEARGRTESTCDWRAARQQLRERERELE